MQIRQTITRNSTCLKYILLPLLLLLVLLFLLLLLLLLLLHLLLLQVSLLFYIVFFPFGPSGTRFLWRQAPAFL